MYKTSPIALTPAKCCAVSKGLLDSCINVRSEILFNAAHDDNHNDGVIIKILNRFTVWSKLTDT